MRAFWICIGLSVSACSEATPEDLTYYVDFGAGDDADAGTSPGAAWKHAPGDPDASGKAARVQLRAGDTVVLRAGVPYRGSIRIPASGVAGRPVTYTGLGWGEGLGIIDGSDPVTSVRPCTSQVDCGGAPQWQSLHKVEFAVPTTSRIALFGKDGLYWMSQVPELQDPFFGDAAENFVDIPVAQLNELLAGKLTSQPLAAAARSGGRTEVALWVRPNRVVRRPVLSVDNDTILFDPTGLDFYSNRATKAALNGSFAGVAAAGHYIELGPGVMIVNLRPGDSAATLSIGNGRSGFDLNRQSHVRIAGLDFRNHAGASGARQEGISIAVSRKGTSHVEVRGNRFGPALLEHGMGVVSMSSGDNFTFVSNRIENIQFGSGLRVGGLADFEVTGNVIKRLGRTAVAMFGVDRARVSGNIITEVKGIHGNAITAYLANKDVTIENNCVLDSIRPVTYHGDKTPEVRNGIVIRNNILIAPPGSQAAISSWGASTNDVLIADNVAVAGRVGIMLHRTDVSVRVINNVSTGIPLRDGVPAGWEVTGNRDIPRGADVTFRLLGDDGCEFFINGVRTATTRDPK